MCPRLRFRVRLSLSYTPNLANPLPSLSFIGTAARATGLSARTKPSLGMLASLDHAMYFYDDDVDVSDFLLFYMECGVVRSGRGLVSGRMYKRDGTLVLACVSRLRSVERIRLTLLAALLATGRCCASCVVVGSVRELE